MKDFNPFLPRAWRLAHGRLLETGPKGLLMGIVNVTPDSFSDGGLHAKPDEAVQAALKMAGSGADIVDIGGESTRPGAEPVNAETEQGRILPVIEALAEAKPDLIVSVDTWRSETAAMAVGAGAHIVNDVWGLQKDPAMAATVAELGAGLVAMHTGRDRDRDRVVIADQKAFLTRTIEMAQTSGIDKDRVLLDPGFGFAKDPDENLELLGGLERLHALGFALLIGTSRKRFLGHVTGQDADRRDIATAATTVVARMKGGAVFRVHDIAANRDALAVADAVLAAQSRLPESG